MSTRANNRKRSDMRVVRTFIQELNLKRSLRGYIKPQGPPNDLPVRKIISQLPRLLQLQKTSFSG